MKENACVVGKENELKSCLFAKNGNSFFNCVSQCSNAFSYDNLSMFGANKFIQMRLSFSTFYNIDVTRFISVAICRNERDNRYLENHSFEKPRMCEVGTHVELFRIKGRVLDNF